MTRQTWTKERVIKEIAPMFSTPSAMAEQGYNGAYRHAKRNGYLNELRAAMGLDARPEWTPEKALAALAGTNNVTEAKAKNSAAYSYVASRPEVKALMGWERKSLKGKTSVTVWSIFRAARKCETRSQMRIEFSNEVKWADEWGIWDRVAASLPSKHMDWTEKAVRAEFATADNRKSIASRARVVAQELGIYDELIQQVPIADRSRPKLWTRERILEVCYQYTDFTQLQLDWPGLRAAVERLGMEDEAYGHTDRRNTWTKDSARAEAQKHDYKSEFFEAAPGAYVFAKHDDRPDGFFEDITSHMSAKEKTLNNVIYLWQIEGEDVFKIGTTSDKPGMGTRRIYFVSKKLGVKPIIHRRKTVARATLVKVKLLKLGVPVRKDVNGGNEFRRLNAEELQEALEIIDGA